MNKKQRAGVSETLKQVAQENGACITGVADLTPLIDLSRGPLRAVVFGLKCCDQAVDALPAEDLWEHMKQDLYARAQTIYTVLENRLRSTCPSARTCRIDRAETVLGINIQNLSQKAIAVLAGMGWIGKSSLLINPVWGPRIRLGTLLTDAVLAADPPLKDNLCENCRICVDACPAKAIAAGSGSRREGFTTFDINTRYCLDYLDRNMAQTGKRGICGICMKVCPFGHLL